MSDRGFLSWHAGWRNALPSGLFSGVVAGTLVPAEGDPRTHTMSQLGERITASPAITGNWLI